ncbi:hypothetical protein D3C85_1761160 [compost metagenome]
MRFTLPPNNVENSGLSRFDLDVSAPARVLRILSCASVILGSAATAVAPRRVVRLTGASDNNAAIPAATLVWTVWVAMT